MNSNITAEELFARITDIKDRKVTQPYIVNKMMHETLVLVCAEALKDTRYGFGDLNSQVETLIRQLHLPTGEANALRQMRRHSNRAAEITPEDLHHDLKALATFVSRVFATRVPDDLVATLPQDRQQHTGTIRSNTPDKRCVVTAWDKDTIRVVVDEDGQQGEMTVNYTQDTQYAHMEYLAAILREGMQLNLLGCETRGNTITPRLIIVEPDCLMDISVIANCFEDYGHHPLLYVIKRMQDKPNTPATLLGNFAGSALDDIINNKNFSTAQTLRHNFREKAMEYSTCTDFNAQKFKQDAATQAANLQQIVGELRQNHDLSRAILEPSFVCEKLGLQGRVDLMTTDLRLLVEQKSGRNIFLERNITNRHGAKVVEKHYVQLLLYYGILYYNFHVSNADIRLLYSKYPLPDGLMSVANLMKLLYEAIRFRNEAVALEYDIARDGMENMLEKFNTGELNREKRDDYFYNTYLRPQLESCVRPLQNLQPLERAYFCRMMQFAIRENLMSKVGVVEGTGNSMADLWNMPLTEKRETGNIYTGLTIINMEKSDETDGYNGFDLITLSVPNQGEDFLPNFRQGDMVFLYAYPPDEEPDLRKAMLFKGGMADIRTGTVTVKLNDGQQNAGIFDRLPYSDNQYSPDAATGARGKLVWCIEHANSDVGGSASIHSLYELITAPADRKALLLGQREPKSDPTVTLSRSYDTLLDPMLLRAKQAKDYFLLVGPPGTGKTSRALRFMVEEILATPTDPAKGDESAILLLSYTNRAVDEICGMLVEAGIDFIRIGNELSCATPYKPYLISQAIGERPKLSDMRQRLTDARVVVATTSMIQARPFLFSLKHFSTAIVDECSQILEPGIIGLLASHRPTAGRTDGDRCNIDKFILIGDYKQLPAVVQQNDGDAAVTDPLLMDIGLKDCKSSLFERLFRQEKKHGRTAFIGTLQRQGRMHPEIADFPAREFYSDERLMPVPLSHQLETTVGYQKPSEDATDDLLKQHRLLFFASQKSNQPSVSDKVNADEATLVVDLLRRIRRFYGTRFDPDKTVGVIVPYRNQIAMIRREIDRLGMPELGEVSIDTVERYQGSQRDVIIYSFTIRHRYQLDFLTANTFEENGHIIDRKLNVAMTRARCQLILTGNPEVLKHSPVFAKMMKYIDEKNGAFIGQRER